MPGIPYANSAWRWALSDWSDNIGGKVAGLVLFPLAFVIVDVSIVADDDQSWSDEIRRRVVVWLIATLAVALGIGAWALIAAVLKQRKALRGMVVALTRTPSVRLVPDAEYVPVPLVLGETKYPGVWTYWVQVFNDGPTALFSARVAEGVTGAVHVGGHDAAWENHSDRFETIEQGTYQRVMLAAVVDDGTFAFYLPYTERWVPGKKRHTVGTTKPNMTAVELDLEIRADGGSPYTQRLTLTWDGSTARLS